MNVMFGTNILKLQDQMLKNLYQDIFPAGGSDPTYDQTMIPESIIEIGLLMVILLKINF